MDKNKFLITGISIYEQMERANKILREEVIPREREYQRRKRNNTLKNT